MFKNSHGLSKVFLMTKKSEKKSLIISTGNLLGQEKSDQSSSFFVNSFLLNIPECLVKLLF